MLEMMTGSLLKKIAEPGLEINPGVFQKLLAIDGAASDYFGISVAASDTSVVIGVQSHLRNGAVYVY